MNCDDLNSCQKGKSGEREFRDVLRSHGYLKARRGQQFSGSPDSPDVVVPELPTLHFEVKRCENTSLYKWIAQAEGDARGKMPVVAHRKNDSKWLIILPEEVFFDILARTDLVEAIQ